MTTSTQNGSEPSSSPSATASGLLALAIQRPVGVLMVVLALLLFGFVGFTKLPVTLLPDLSYPTITVRTEYEGASPEDVEDRISEPIREAVSVLSKVVRVTSVSRAGQSDVIVEFAWGTEMVYAVGDVREKVDRVFLPRDVDKPLYLRYDPSLDPILTIGFTNEGSKLDTMAVRDLVEEDIKRELQEVEGVAAVKVKGGDEKEIMIAVDPSKLTALGLDIRTIAQKIGAENLNASAGVLEEGQTEYLVRALGEFEDLDDVRELIVERRNDANIYLRDVAHVFRTPKEKEVITRIDGRPAVLVEVFKEADANLVELSKRVRERLFGSAEQQAYVKALASGKGKFAGGGVKPKQAGVAEASLGSNGGGQKAESGTAKKTDKSKTTDKSKSSKKGGGDFDRMRMIRHARMTDFIAYRMPKGTKARVLSNPATYIENSIQEVLGSAVLGGLFAVLVIFVFLRHGRPTFLISLAIPISLLITFAPLHLSSVTLNVMSLGGLALGVGMLVDTSIVVLESITRCREEGQGLVEAAVNGVKQVSGAVIASTLTTVAVFLPIVFVEGVAGQLFRDQALAVVFSLIASLGVSLFLLPMLASRGQIGKPKPADAPPLPLEPGAGFLKRVSRTTDRATAGLAKVTTWIATMAAIVAVKIGAIVRVLVAWLLIPFTWLFNAVYTPLERIYPHVLRVALRARLAILLVALGLAALAGLRFGSLGSEVIPEVHEGQFEALVFLARDVDVERTDEISAPLEQKIRKLEHVERTFLTSGTARDELRSSEEGRHSARINIVLSPGPDMARREYEARESVRQLLLDDAAVQNFRFQTPTLFSVRTPVSIEVYGHDLRDLMTASQAVAKRLESLPNLTDIRSTLNRGNTEVVVRFDRERLAQLGLDIGEASRRLAAMVQGEVPTRFSEQDKKVDMRVRVDPDRLASVRSLRLTDMSAGGDTAILLESVADLEYVEGPSEIRRLGSRRGAEIEATLVGLDLGRVQDQIDTALSGLVLPDGIELRLGGQREEMERSKGSMIEALLLAIFLVYVVMAAQFESLVQPLIIIFSVPLGLIGVVLALDVLDIPISVVVFIGGIMLAGIVVNNAIVLIDRINQDRASGMSTIDAVIHGASVRFRPVLMTTATTVLGLLPLTGLLPSLPVLGAAGEGVELRAPMAITVITGLTFSTLLTLIVIPVIYSLVVRDRAVADVPNEAAGA